MVFSRPPKLSHAQTILYEIDMFRYAAAKLSEGKWSSEIEQWVCLEDFLLHFRNLIEFFGHSNPRPDDLNVSRPDAIWRHLESRPAEADLAKLRRQDLWDKYEGDRPDKISRYLHHCTEARTDFKNWDVGVMYAELDPTTKDFERLLSDGSRPWRPQPAVAISSVLSASTVSASAPMQVDITPFLPPAKT